VSLQDEKKNLDDFIDYSLKLQDFAIWMTGCCEMTKHKYFVDNRYLLSEQPVNPNEIINKVLDAAIESVEHRYRFTVAEYDSGIFDAIKSIQALKVNESEETNGN